jgi:hypothetical protein
MGEVLRFRGITTVDETADQVLEKAKTWGMAKCIIIGLDDAGILKFGGTLSEAGEIMIMIEAAKIELIKNTLE